MDSNFSTLDLYASHGSISYGQIRPERLKHILLGEEPRKEERARVYQALMETPGFCAFDLAAELGISYSALNERAMSLFGENLPR